jgi:hypothetical protein
MTQVTQHNGNASIPDETRFESASHLTRLDDEYLVAELEALGVHFLRSTHKSAITASERIAPAMFIARLASSDDARLRLALIPLLLHRPDFAVYINTAIKINATAHIVLKCYYTAALFLQQKYRSRLEKLMGSYQTLPDLFSAELGLHAVSNPNVSLRLLAQRHAELSGKTINWLGTYEHAAQCWLKHMERRKLWQT